MPFEVFLVIIVSIVAGTFCLVSIAKMIVGAIERRRLLTTSENSVTRGELAEMVGEAVRQALLPLQERMELMQGPGSEHEGRHVLQAHDDDDSSITDP